jgi:hypothetical protein
VSDRTRQRRVGAYLGGANLGTREPTPRRSQGIVDCVFGVTVPVGGSRELAHTMAELVKVLADALARYYRP